MRSEIAFGQKKWAVVGAGNNPDKFGCKIYKMLRDAGFVVYPVNPAYTEVLGDVCYPSLHALPEKVDMVSIVVKPEYAANYVADYDAVFWFQPNTFTAETLSLVRGEYIADRCVLVEYKQATVRMAKYIQSMVKWLRERVDEAGANGLVLGISGGVDSAVVGGIIKKAFPDQAKGLILPCYSSQKDIEDGKKVCEALSLSYEIVDIGEPHRLIMEAFSFDPKNAASMRASDSNLRARLRMAAAYAYANYHGYLTVGTDNAAELHIGYFTKYGDGGVDLLPIAQLLKCEVFHMARLLGVPKEVVYKAPSAGLWEGQTDEGEIGVTYDDIDRLLTGDAVSERAAEIVERMHRNSAHKRQTPPYPVIKSADDI